MLGRSEPGPDALAELVEAEAWAQMHSALPEAVRAQLGVSVHRKDGATALVTRHCAELAVNRVIALGVTAPALAETLDSLVSAYREAGIARCLVHVSPGARPSGLGDLLVARGFVARAGLAKLIRSTSNPVPPRASTGLRVVEIGHHEGDTFTEIVAGPLQVPVAMRPAIRSTIGHPGWRYYLVYFGDRAVAGAALFATEGIGWCGLAGTLKAERGRGAQSALLARRIADAAAMGCRWVVAETLPEREGRRNSSVRNMERLGFEMLYERPNYISGPSDAPPVATSSTRSS